MLEDGRAKAQDEQTRVYVGWLKSNRDMLSNARLQEYPHLYKMLIANHDALRSFLIEITDILIRDTMNAYTHRLPDQHGCIPIQLTVDRLKGKLKYDAMELTGDAHDKMVLLHAVWLIKRIIAPAPQMPNQDSGKYPKYIYADLYTPEHLSRVEDRVRRWAIVTGRRQSLSKDDCIWLYGQHDADLIFIPSTRTETQASIDATYQYVQAYRRAEARATGHPVTAKAVKSQLWKLFQNIVPEDSPDKRRLIIRDKVNEVCHRAKIPLYMEYGLQNRQLTKEEKAQYGITDRTAWGIMKADEKIVSEMRKKRDGEPLQE